MFEDYGRVSILNEHTRNILTTLDLVLLKLDKVPGSKLSIVAFLAL